MRRVFLHLEWHNRVLFIPDLIVWHRITFRIFEKSFRRLHLNAMHFLYGLYMEQTRGLLLRSQIFAQIALIIIYFTWYRYAKDLKYFFNSPDMYSNENIGEGESP